MSITIQCEGEDLPEYSHEVHDKSATCYIPSVEGKHFQVCIVRGASRTSVSVQVYFDGGRHSGMHFFFRGSKKDEKQIRDSVRVNQSMKRRVVFSQLKLTDDEDVLSAASCIDTNALGTIRVRVEYVIEVPRSLSHSAGIGSSNKDVVHSGIVHERAKKSGGHIVSLGEEISAPTYPSSTECFNVDLPPHEVTFRYAPSNVLRAREIIPSPPAPLANATPASGDGLAASIAPLPAKAKRGREDVDDVSDQSGFSDEEEARVYARLRAKKMAKQSSLAKIKLEENGIPAGIFKRGEVIDLTED